MDFTNEVLGAKLSLPDRPTVRQQLRYQGEIGARMGGELYIRLWAGAKTIITGWECAHVTLDADLDEITDPTAARCLMWAGLQVYSFIDALEDVPKNS